MATAAVDLEDLLKDLPPGAWVAVSEQKNSVLSYGPDAQEVLRKAREQKEEEPLLIRVPERPSLMFF